MTREIIVDSFAGGGACIRGDPVSCRRIDARAANARYDDDVLLHYLQQMARLLQHTPSIRDTNQADGPCAATYQDHFGSWRSAHIAAGLPPNGVGCAPGTRYNRPRASWTKRFADDRPNSYRGIFYDSSERHPRQKAWAAAIEVRGKRIRLGRYYTPEDAARAYDAAAVEYVGAGAVVNFPRAECAA